MSLTISTSASCKEGLPSFEKLQRNVNFEVLTCDAPTMENVAHWRPMMGLNRIDQAYEKIRCQANTLPQGLENPPLEKLPELPSGKYILHVTCPENISRVIKSYATVQDKKDTSFLKDQFFFSTTLYSTTKKNALYAGYAVGFILSVPPRSLVIANREDSYNPYLNFDLKAADRRRYATFHTKYQLIIGYVRTIYKNCPHKDQIDKYAGFPSRHLEKEKGKLKELDRIQRLVSFYASHPTEDNDQTFQAIFQRSAAVGETVLEELKSIYRSITDIKRLQGPCARLELRRFLHPKRILSSGNLYQVSWKVQAQRSLVWLGQNLGYFQGVELPQGEKIAALDPSRIVNELLVLGNEVTAELNFPEKLELRGLVVKSDFLKNGENHLFLEKMRNQANDCGLPIYTLPN